MSNRKNSFIEFIKEIIIWVFSNLLWTIISFCLPLGLIIPVVYNAFKGIVSSITNYILISIFIILEIVFVIALFKVSKSKKETNMNNEEESTKEVDKNEESSDNTIEKKNVYENLDYYFKEYHKHLTVYRNGNGIIINSFSVVYNNINSITQFKRELNIEDAKASTNFPPLEDMIKQGLEDRFSSFCFKCKCINNEDLISSIEEKYWTEDSNDGDDVARRNPKVLKWILTMNPSCIEIGKEYKFVYIISIPGMFPIENGLFVDDIANIKGTHGTFTSQFNVKHKIKEMLYTVSFEESLVLAKKPMGKIYEGGRNTNISYTNDNNIIYDKYVFRIEDPEVGNSINIKWNFK